MFEKEVPVQLVALAATAVCKPIGMTGPISFKLALQIKCILLAYEQGYWNDDLEFSGPVFASTYNGILKLLDRMKNNPDPYHWNKFCAARRSWAETAALSCIPLYR